jgi:hypothetical protein
VRWWRGYIEKPFGSGENVAKYLYRKQIGNPKAYKAPPSPFYRRENAEIRFSNTSETYKVLTWQKPSPDRKAIQCL